MNQVIKKVTKIKEVQSKVKLRLNLHIPLSPAKTTEVYDSFWKFAALRQEAFFNRFKGNPFPWTDDPIINRYKFTNVYRASDRVSQYLIKNVIYKNDLPDSPKEILFRILLFKLFNKIETWELLKSKIGYLTFENYNFKQYDDVLSSAIANGTIYSAAYIMPSGKSFFGYLRKHSNHLKLIELIIKNDTHEQLIAAKTMQQAFEITKTVPPGLGDFLGLPAINRY